MVMLSLTTLQYVKYFNKYYVNAASELAYKIPKTKTDPTKSMKTKPFLICGKRLYGDTQSPK